MVIRFLKKSLLLALLIIGSAIVICFLPSETLFYVFVDKEQRLQTVPAPRLIFIGGSGLMYGLDSPCIEAALGLPVVNMGLHGGLGLRFALDHVRPYIRKNDILVVVPEYGVLLRGYRYNAPTTALIAFTDPRIVIGSFSLRDYLEALPGYPTIAYAKLVSRPISMLQKAQKPFVYASPLYWRKSFNTNGDILTHLSAPPAAGALANIPPIQDRNVTDSITMLNDFTEEATHKGAQVFLIPAPLIDVQYQQSIPTVTAIYTQLQQELKLSTLAAPSDYIYPVSYFYDTPQHLNAIGRKVRTEQLLTDLRKIPSLARVATTTTTCK